MSSVKSSSSVGDSNCRELERQHDGRGGEIVKMGYLRKLKRLRKKFFVLRGESSDSSARLEYYDSEKKWRSNHSPKRSILLKTCFNINRRLDTKHKHVIALYTKDDCFCLVLESEEDLEDWLKSLLSLQQGEDVPEGELPKPTYEHVWQVTVKEKGLGNSHNILGPFRLCLTDKTLSLVKVGPSDNPQTYEFLLNGIRRCGHSDCFFYMEVGRSSCTGAGDLWMQTEDTNIAQNMHGSILHAMTANKEGSRARTHSSPKTELKMKQGGRNQSNYGKPPYSASDKYSSDSCFEHQPSLVHNQVSVGAPCHRHTGCPSHPPVTAVLPSQRRHSVSAMYVSPVAAPPNHQRTYSFPLSDSTPPPRLGSRRVSVTAGRTSTTGPGRDRSDSMPSRNRTTSEGHMQPPHVPTRGHFGGLRPHSMYNRGISHSPPVGSSPVSPISGGAYSDSAGSSLSIDESDGLVESGCDTIGSGLLRYSHSLTPDEPPIQEEMCDDYCLEAPCGNGVPNHMRLPASLTLPISPPLPLAQKVSPNLITGFKSGSPSQGSYSDICSPCSSSPLETSGYIAMSPGSGVGNDTTQRTSGAYSHSLGSVNHSRGSSLAEEPYVPMGPSSTQRENYVDMDHSNSHHFHHGEMSPSSSCSITSGTPSTDLRFSEYHLEKVSSYFTPSEDDDNSSIERPIRAYSVGSRPDTLRKSNRLEPSPLVEDNSRVRAFSVGSRLASRINLGRPRLPPQAPTPPGQKSSSAPLLSSSWSGSGGPMADLMELDFTSRKGVAPPRSTLRHLVPPSSHIGSSNELQSSPPGPYLDMRPGSSVTSSPQSSVYVDTRPRSPPPNVESGSPKTGPYVDMRPGSSPPVKIPASDAKAPKCRDPVLKSSPGVGKVLENHSNYLEMTPTNVSNSPSTKVRETDVKPILNSVKIQEHTKNVERKVSVGKIPSSNGSHFETKPTLKCGGEGSYNGMKPPLGSVRRDVNGAYHDSKVNSTIIRNKDVNGGYAEMKPSPNLTKVRDSNAVNSPDSKISPNIVWPSHDKSSYVEMHPKTTAKVHSFPTTISVSPKTAAGPYVDMKPGDSFHLTGANFSRKPTSPIQEEYVDMTPRREETAVTAPTGVARTAPVDTPQPKKQTEGYVEMSWTRGSKPGRRSALEDYHPLSVTPPGFLPLSPSPSSSPSSSLQRTHRTKVADLATPTAIFPFSLNSPSSPVKQLPGSEPNRKCSIDATSGTLKISQSPGSESSSSSEQPTPVNVESQDYVDCNPREQEVPNIGSKNSYNFASPERPGKASSSSSDQQDYVNCLPSQERTRKLSFASSESSPVRTRKISAPASCHTQVGVLQQNSSNPTSGQPLPVYSQDGSKSEKAVSSNQCSANPKENVKILGSDGKLSLDADRPQSSAPEPESRVEKRNFVNSNLTEISKRPNSPAIPSAAQTCSSSEVVANSESPKALADAKNGGHPHRHPRWSHQDPEPCRRQVSRSSSTSSESGRGGGGVVKQQQQPPPGPSSKIPVSTCLRSQQDGDGGARRLSRSSSGSSESGRSQKELHYASLDLGFEGEDCCRSQRILNDSPSPLAVESNSYAQIDFSRNTSRQMH